MTAAEGSLKLVEELPGSLVESLIVQLRSGAVPAMPNPGYQGRVDEFLRCQADVRGELAPMLEVALAAKRSRQTAELVWTGPATPVVPVRRTEQVLSDLILVGGDGVIIAGHANQPLPRGTTISYDGGTWYVLTEGTDPALMIKVA